MIRNIEDNTNFKDIQDLYPVASSWCVEDIGIKTLKLTS